MKKVLAGNFAGSSPRPKRGRGQIETKEAKPGACCGFFDSKSETGLAILRGKHRAMHLCITEQQRELNRLGDVARQAESRLAINNKTMEFYTDQWNQLFLGLQLVSERLGLDKVDLSPFFQNKRSSKRSKGRSAADSSSSSSSSSGAALPAPSAHIDALLDLALDEEIDSDVWKSVFEGKRQSTIELLTKIAVKVEGKLSDDRPAGSEQAELDQARAAIQKQQAQLLKAQNEAAALLEERDSLKEQLNSTTTQLNIASRQLCEVKLDAAAAAAVAPPPSSSPTKTESTSSSSSSSSSSFSSSSSSSSSLSGSSSSSSLSGSMNSPPGQRPPNKKQRLLTPSRSSQDSESLGTCPSPVQKSSSSTASSSSSSSSSSQPSVAELENELEATLKELLAKTLELKELKKKQLDDTKSLQLQLEQSQTEVLRLKEELHLPANDETVKQSPLYRQLGVQIEHLQKQEQVAREQLQSKERSLAETSGRLSQEKKDVESALQARIGELEAAKQKVAARVHELELEGKRVGSQLAEAMAENERLAKSPAGQEDSGAEMFRLRLTNSKLVSSLESQKTVFEKTAGLMKEEAGRLGAACEAQRSHVVELRELNKALEAKLKVVEEHVRHSMRTLQQREEEAQTMKVQSGVQQETIKQYQERVFSEPRLVTTLKGQVEQLEKETQRLEEEKKKLERQAAQASKKSQGSSTSKLEALLEYHEERSRCNVCKDRMRNTALSGCGHVFCDQCVQELIDKRNRKCPECRNKFSTGDQIKLFFGDDEAN